MSNNKKQIKIEPKNKLQRQFVNSVSDKPITFATGCAGSGKTFLSAALALEYLSYNFVDKIINVRPIVATEDIGFLPGDMAAKLDPYLQPLMDAYESIYDPKTVGELVRSRQIQIATLAHMRGRNLTNAFIILDEAQNTTIKQMHMFLTRFGENVKVVITGDPSPAQTDIRGENGLVWAMDKLSSSKNVGIIQYTEKDVVRSELVKELLTHIEDDRFDRNRRVFSDSKENSRVEV
jgi:phosphate starvation-inducible PhoH-like protein